ncbi:MAG: thioesterase, partial [Actinobacteria bacterium]|nr:thioesterase [Actinomycetota bacterium]
MTKFPDDIDPVMLEIIRSTNGGELTVKMGVEYLELAPDYSVARMPVEGNRQVIGLLHGGAHVV